MDVKTLRYIKRRTKHMTPSERYIWFTRDVSETLRKESISYVNGNPIPINPDYEFVAQAMLDKEEQELEGTGALID
jgi:hypothetical protein